MTKLRLAIIGCGAVTERLHLPTSGIYPQCRVTVLVDKDQKRAQQLAEKYHVPGVETDFREVLGHADAAIVALPHHLHAPVSIELLKRGIHVLVEKPMAMSNRECAAMIDAAESSGAVLAVGLLRRFWRSTQKAKQIIDSGLLGNIQSFDFREGNVYSWPVASDSLFRRDTGGGVLFDTGAHTLDSLLWWLGDIDSFEYMDDSYGGAEADCELHATMKSGAKGIVELSRTRALRNTAIICGEKGKIEVHLHQNLISVSLSDNTVGVTEHDKGKQPLRMEKQSFENLFSAQLQDWISAIRSGRSPTVTGRDGQKSVALIEACHAGRRLLRLPWV